MGGRSREHSRLAKASVENIIIRASEKDLPVQADTLKVHRKTSLIVDFYLVKLL